MRVRRVPAAAGCWVALACCGLAPSTADAASYSVWSCRGPDGAALSARAWSAGPDQSGTSDSCADGGSLRAELLPSDGPQGLVRGFRFLLPGGAAITGYQMELAAATAEAKDRDAYQAGIASDAPATVSDIDVGCPTAGCAFGTPGVPLDPKNVIASGGLDSHGLVAGVRCGAFLGCYLGDIVQLGPLAQMRLFRSRVDIRDDTLPVVAAGSVTAGPASGPATVAADVSDAGGGVAVVALLVDGVEVQRRATELCREPYTEPAPCPAQIPARFTVDATALAPGTHAVQVRGIDAANNSSTGAEMALTAVSPSPPAGSSGSGTPAGSGTLSVSERTVVLTPQPVVIAVTPKRVDLAPGAPRITGTVTGEDGKPVAGVTVLVRSRPFGIFRSKLRPEPSLTTDAAGRFSLAATGTSRILRFDVDDSGHRAADAVEVDLMQRLRVSLDVADRSLHNGSAMTLRATVAGAGRGARGKVVLVQAVVRGAWATVASLATSSSGHTSWRYRFHGTTRPAIYRFRVRVERAGDVWPWRTTNSREVHVTVRP